MADHREEPGRPATATQSNPGLQLPKQSVVWAKQLADAPDMQRADRGPRPHWVGLTQHGSCPLNLHWALNWPRNHSALVGWH
jgi:hypothetical protein